MFHPAIFRGKITTLHDDEILCALLPMLTIVFPVCVDIFRKTSKVLVSIKNMLFGQKTMDNIVLIAFWLLSFGDGSIDGARWYDMQPCLNQTCLA